MIHFKFTSAILLVSGILLASPKTYADDSEIENCIHSVRVTCLAEKRKHHDCRTQIRITECNAECVEEANQKCDPLTAESGAWDVGTERCASGLSLSGEKLKGYQAACESASGEVVPGRQEGTYCCKPPAAASPEEQAKREQEEFGKMSKECQVKVRNCLKKTKASQSSCQIANGC